MPRTHKQYINNTHGQATRRIIKLFGEATPAELQEGLTWYARANEFARQLAAQHGITMLQAAAVIANLSPQKGWEANVKLAQQYLETGKSGHTGAQTRKCDAIMAGEPIDENLGNLRKVPSFYDNIAFPETSTEVTIDRHAYDAAVGMRAGDKAHKQLESNICYEQFAEVYRRAADRLGLAPHVVQAVVWTVWRNRYAFTRDGQ